MTRLKVILIAVLAIALAGCVLSGKPKPATPPPAPQPAPAQPQEPLSIPQTTVELPPFQPVDPKALATVQPAEPAPPPEEAKPVTPPAPKPARQTATPPAKPAESAPPPEPEPSRTPIQEILPADQQKHLQESAQRARSETRNALTVVNRRRRYLTDKEKREVDDVSQLMKQSLEAETAGDMRLADQLAQRALLVVKELQSGK